MRDMYQRTKAGTMPTFATADFLNSVNRVSGGDYSEFFAHYITGTETLPVDKYVQQIGLRVEANGSFVRDAASGVVYMVTRRPVPQAFPPALARRSDQVVGLRLAVQQSL